MKAPTLLVILLGSSIHPYAAPLQGDDGSVAALGPQDDGSIALNSVISKDQIEHELVNCSEFSNNKERGVMTPIECMEKRQPNKSLNGREDLEQAEESLRCFMSKGEVVTFDQALPPRVAPIDCFSS
ncbi:hypothetical protein NP233_g8157 [Leucocoprinus birnbaumii]|uniref:Uncharacterized protein n=1 Tax=Leucocoprinus birnbaumii TaxID=56174 RepID=A0AAD5YPB4_9AGAR|nr:hypothetical protein NP233_g8157 [Leucocoprinus birnbaumii]